MSAYTRNPKRIVVRCRICPWVGIYFEDSRKRMRHAARAQQAIETHLRRAHHKKTLINGR